MGALEERGNAILRRLPARARVAEIGVLYGALSKYVLERSDCHMTMVDSWAPAYRQPGHYRETGDIRALQDQAEVDEIRSIAKGIARRFRRRATVLDMKSVDAAKHVVDSSLDLVFIDADHSYEGVKADLAAWAPKVKPGGWIGGHDYGNPDPRYRFGVEQAVDEWAAGERRIDLDDNFTWWVRL